MDRILDICQKESLDVVMVENKVYKNNTSDKVINIDKLKRELENCWLLISDAIYKKTNEGYHIKYAKIYYIIDDAQNKDLLLVYAEKAEKEFGEVFPDFFKFDPNGDNCISTIYGPDELGRV